MAASSASTPPAAPPATAPMLEEEEEEGQSVRLVPEVEYDVPMEPTLTRQPDSPVLLYTSLDHHHSHPPLSDTWTRTSQVRGNAYQRVRCSHNCVTAVIKPSSVGRLPSRLVRNTELDHNHSHHLSATHGHEHLK